MKKILIALVLLVPALAVGQEKYTNADLDIPPKKDAYTNADIERLPPLPVQAAPAVAPRPVPLPPRDLAAERRAAQREVLDLDLEMVDVEIAYWKSIIDEAYSAAGSINDYPRKGAGSAEARQRLARLQRVRHMLVEEISRLY
jgi:hypothetical protein